MTKCCNQCKLEKPLDDFINSKQSKDGKRANCKKCHAEYTAKWRMLRTSEQHQAYNEQCKKYRENHLEACRSASREHARENRIQRIEYNRQYSQENKEKIVEKNRKYYEKNRDRIYNRTSKYAKERKTTCLQFRLAVALRSRLNSAVRNNYKAGSAVSDLGCSIEEFKQYIETKFQPGMTWENWSRTGWHIDHVYPISKFDLSDLDQLKVACHYTNLQPMWATDNLKKHNKVI